MKKATNMFASALFVLVLLLTVILSNAQPEGASIVNTSVTSKNATPAGSRQDPKGSITTVRLDTTQQNIKWKAYVGNVSGTLVLRDADDYSIYQWPSGGSPSGEVYMTMNSSVDWSTIQCANQTDIQNQQTSLGHGSTSMDNINNTFSYSLHRSFAVGELTIPASQCRVTYMWQNSSAQTPSQNALFQEVLLMDTNRRIVYTSMINQDTSSYRNDASGSPSLGNNVTYDFQAIVPDYTGLAIATYYFYVEIDG